MSVTALVSELSECELSDQGCTATHEFVRRADSYPTTSCQLLRRNVLKDFGKGPGMTSPLQLSDRVRWVRVLLGLPWTGMSRCGNLIKTPPSTVVCSLHPCQLLSKPVRAGPTGLGNQLNSGRASVLATNEPGSSLHHPLLWKGPLLFVKSESVPRPDTLCLAKSQS